VPPKHAAAAATRAAAGSFRAVVYADVEQWMSVAELEETTRDRYEDLIRRRRFRINQQ